MVFQHKNNTWPLQVFINVGLFLGVFIDSTATAKQNCDLKQQKVIFIPNDIFNEDDQDIRFFHRWANIIHIKTKQITLTNEAAFFLNKCNKNQNDLAELERHLRNQKYLRDAKVTSDLAIKNIKVETWDTWSLMPTISFGRKGGVNTYSFGIKDRNLLGLGIDTQIESFTNAQRSGYQFESRIPLYQKKNTELSMVFSDNNDGQKREIFITKSFAGFYTPYAYTIGFNKESRNDTIFQNGGTQTVFKHDINYKTVSYAWTSINNPQYNLRYYLGISKEQDRFNALTALFPTNLAKQKNQQLPQDRDFTYPWFKVEYTGQNFKKLTNIHLVTQIEDFNFGWEINAKIAMADGSQADSAWALWQTNISKGLELNNRSILLFNLHLSGDIYDAASSRILAKIETEFFYRFSDFWSLYVNNTNVMSKKQYLDLPVTLGGDSGMRGFPLQYQHGNNSFKLTSELRYYPHINIFKLFELAGTAFVDVGRVSGKAPVKNIDRGWLYSVGIGARIYSAHSSIGRVIHIDLAKPFSDNPDLGGFELRLQAKETF